MSGDLLAAKAVIDVMPGHRYSGLPGHVVPAWVTKPDIQASYGRLAVGGRIGDAAYGDVLQLFHRAVRQPVLDKTFKPTGEIRSGASGIVTLDDGLSENVHRKLYFGYEALAAIAVAAGSRGMEALSLLKVGSAARQELVKARRESQRSEPQHPPNPPVQGRAR